MKSYTYTFGQIRKVRDFCQKAIQQNFDIECRQKSFTVDAKSILGLFSLDLTQPITIEFPTISNNSDFEQYIIALGATKV